MNYSERERWWTLLGEDAVKLAPPSEQKALRKKRKVQAKAQQAPVVLADSPKPVNVFGKLSALLSGITSLGQKKKELRLCDTVPLGDKRFVAVVQFEDQRFLVGSSTNGISLLSELPSALPTTVATKDFSAVLKQQLEGDRPAV